MGREADMSCVDIHNKFQQKDLSKIDDAQMEEAMRSLDDDANAAANMKDKPQIIRDLYREMNALKDDDLHSVFNENRQKIVDYFAENIASYKVLQALNRKEFVNQISSQCCDNGMRCKLSTIYDAMRKYYAQDANGKLVYEDEDIDEILEELDVMESKEKKLELWVRSIWIVGSLIEYRENDEGVWMTGRIERMIDDKLQIKNVDDRSAVSLQIERDDEKKLRPLAKALHVYQYVYENVHKDQ